MQRASKQFFRTSLILTLAASFLFVSHLRAQSPQPASHTYRNLFLEDGHTASQIDARLQLAYNQLFHGDPATQAIYFPAGSNANGPLSYITDWANHDVRTEGMSYGMMIAVELNHKADFDAIWNWAMTYMYIADEKLPSVGYFAWSCKTDGTRNSLGPAPDGEEYFVMALYFASARWGDGAGIYDYHAQADRLLRSLIHHDPSGATSAQLGKSAEFDVSHHMVRFVPYADFTDPSYHLPAFYELWAIWGPSEDRSFWLAVAKASRAFFAASADPTTGLTPAYANFDGSPHQTKFGQSTIFGFDSWRTASNWSVDWSWWHSDPEEQRLSDRIERFFTSKGPDYPSIYTLTGAPLGPNDSVPSTAAAKPARANDHSPDYQHASGLVSTNAVTALAVTDRTLARPFVEALWALPVPDGQFRYYNGMLYLMSMLHCSGQFRIWQPAWANMPPHTASAVTAAAPVAH